MEGPTNAGEASSATVIEHPCFFHLALLRVDKVGPVLFRQLRQYFGSEKAVFKADNHELAGIGLSSKALQQIKEVRQFVHSEKNEIASDGNIVHGVMRDIQWLSHTQHHVLNQESHLFPSLLRQIHDCPPVLFVIGNPQLLSSPQLAIVGSRRPTRSGCQNAEQFANALATQGLVITSGLASGIDSFAHKGALSAKSSSTIAVLAHGLDGIYPKRNSQLAAHIVNSGGALVSEFPVGVTPRPEFFPRRNRIISGLSLGVLVVEAARKSGSLVTAYSALEQNREVFAIPGSIHNPVAQGCHQLIRSGAKLVESCEDIFEELPTIICQQKGKAKEKVKVATEKLDAKERKVLGFLSDEESSLNEIGRALNMAIDELASLLMMLELKGLVQQGASGYCLSANQS